jgi:UDP-N-acetylmuramate dehydrogenase
VSERHANFIVNASGSARAGDVVSLIEEVRERVHRSYAFRLQTEIVLA